MDKKTGKRRIWIYKDKITGKGKGEATITYDDPPTASSAINWFGGTIVNDQNLVSGHFYCSFFFFCTAEYEYSLMLNFGFFYILPKS